MLFLHGLESGPSGRKAQWLAEHHGAVTPDLQTTALVEALTAGGVQSPADFEAAAAPCLAIAREALHDEKPQILVGSSFGGALAVALMREGLWRGPTLLLACASRRLLGDVKIPAGLRVVLVHGRNDDVVPLSDARWLAETAGPGTLLWEVADDHRLGAQLDNGVVSAALGWLGRAL